MRILIFNFVIINSFVDKMGNGNLIYIQIICGPSFSQLYPQLINVGDKLMEHPELRVWPTFNVKILYLWEVVCIFARCIYMTNEQLHCRMFLDRSYSLPNNRASCDFINWIIVSLGSHDLWAQCRYRLLQQRALIRYIGELPISNFRSGCKFDHYKRFE